MPAQIFDHRKTKTFCFRRGEHVVYNMIKYKKRSMDHSIDSAENDEQGWSFTVN